MAQEERGPGRPGATPGERGSTASDERPWKVEPGTAIKIGAGLFLLVIFILFIIQNADPVLVNFVFFRANIRLIWVFLGCAVIGGVIAWLVGRPRRRAMKRLVEELERQRRER
ncbi:MAG: LapA family protein [Actinomycetota bacterium]